MLCAPSLGGESFGMVLTEAFAAGTPVIASDIAGYRDVVRDGDDGLLVPRGDATRWPSSCATWRSIPPRRAGWAPRRRGSRPAVRLAARRRRGPRRLRGRDRRAPRRAAGLAAASGSALAADGLDRRAGAPDAEPRAADRRRGPPAPRGPSRAASAIGLARSPAWDSRAGAAAHRHRPHRRRRSGARARRGCSRSGADVPLHGLSRRGLARHPARGAAGDAGAACATPLRGTAIGVLMSATLPARLGEPSRALVVARRIGRPRQACRCRGHDRVPDAARRARPDHPGARDVLHRWGCSPAITARSSLFAALSPVVILLARHRRPPALLRKGAPSRSRRVGRPVGGAGPPGAHARARRSARLPQPRGWGPRRRSCSSAPGRCSGSPATSCSWRSGSTMRAGLGAAAAVLFAVNVTAGVPLTPSNLGVFQAACVAGLHAGWHVGAADAPGLRRSSSRPSRSPRPSSWARRRWSARGCPGRTSACAPCTPRRSSSPPARDLAPAHHARRGRSRELALRPAH